MTPFVTLALAHTLIAICFYMAPTPSGHFLNSGPGLVGGYAVLGLGLSWFRFARLP